MKMKGVAGAAHNPEPCVIGMRDDNLNLEINGLSGEALSPCHSHWPFQTDGWLHFACEGCAKCRDAGMLALPPCFWEWRQEDQVKGPCEGAGTGETGQDLAWIWLVFAQLELPSSRVSSRPVALIRDLSRARPVPAWDLLAFVSCVSSTLLHLNLCC